MAHEVETMAYANAVPWHGLGARVDGSLTPDEMLVAAGLNWEIVKRPLFMQVNGEFKQFKDRVAVVRETDERVLAVTSPNWMPMQNREVLGFFREYAAAGVLTLETAGSLRRGKYVWALARMGRTYDATPGDTMNSYILIISPNIVGSAITVRTTSVRVVCANTMALAEGRNAPHYSKNHMSEFDVSAAKEAVGRAHAQLDRAERQAKILAGLKLGRDDAVQALASVVEPTMAPESIGDPDRWSSTIKGIMASVDGAPGADPSTAWGLLQGYSHWSDHSAGRSADTRMIRSWLGDRAGVKLQLAEHLTEMAGANLEAA